jgi:hypothetical protein
MILDLLRVMLPHSERRLGLRNRFQGEVRNGGAAPPSQVIAGGRLRKGGKAPLRVVYPIFQVSPETNSFAMSPGPRSDIDFCSC